MARGRGRPWIGSGDLLDWHGHSIPALLNFGFENCSGEDSSSALVPHLQCGGAPGGSLRGRGSRSVPRPALTRPRPAPEPPGTQGAGGTRPSRPRRRAPSAPGWVSEVRAVGGCMGPEGVASGSPAYPCLEASPGIGAAGSLGSRGGARGRRPA